MCSAGVAITLATMADRSLRRPDYRGVAATIGRPAPDVGVFTAYQGSEPLARYLPGATDAPPEGAALRGLELVLPLGRSDEDGPSRPATPAPPAGFTLAARDEHATFTRVRYVASTPVTVTAAGLAPLAPGSSTFPARLLIWPRAGAP